MGTTLVSFHEIDLFPDPYDQADVYRAGTLTNKNLPGNRNLLKLNILRQKP
jgi:hypothetical protein